VCILQAQFSAGSNALQFTPLQSSNSPLSLRQVALSKLALNEHIDNRALYYYPWCALQWGRVFAGVLSIPQGFTIPCV